VSALGRSPEEHQGRLICTAPGAASMQYAAMLSTVMAQLRRHAAVMRPCQLHWTRSRMAASCTVCLSARRSCRHIQWSSAVLSCCGFMANPAASRIRLAPLSAYVGVAGTVTTEFARAGRYLTACSRAHSQQGMVRALRAHRVRPRVVPKAQDILRYSRTRWCLLRHALGLASGGSDASQRLPQGYA